MEYVFIFAGVCVVLSGLALSGQIYSRKQQLKRSISNAPRPLGPNPEEGVRLKLVGKAHQHEERLQSPISQRPCFGWHVIVKAKELGTYTTVLDKQSVVSVFKIATPDFGDVEVHASASDLALDVDHHAARRPRTSELEAHVVEFLSRCGVD